jgi:DedD protein
MLKKASPKTGQSSPKLDDVRRQSRHRLIGASLLVVVAVVGFPMVFDNQPRRIPVDLPIHIPAQPPVSPLTPVAAVPAEPPAPSTTPAPTPAPAPAPAPAPVAKAPPPAPAAKPAAPAPSKPDAAGERFVVQVGAYADAASVRNVRQRIERAGLKTYTQVAKTPEGDRTRVRLGPFNSRAEAERAAQKIKSLGLTSSILTL